MGQRAEDFLTSFNHIEKWLREKLGNPVNVGFSEMTRRLARKKESQVRYFEDDLLQMAQLRNAIIHERISADFIIAEPNEWAVGRIKQIEQTLIHPEQVLPRFSKAVTGFESNITLKQILEIIAKKRYSQFPIYTNGVFKGLITVSALGVWFAIEMTNGTLEIEGKTAADLLKENYKQSNYQFVSARTNVYEVEELFSRNRRLEAVLITKDGNPNGNLLGIIRPRDLSNISEKE